MGNVNDKVVIITGGATGYGYGTAKTLKAQGAEVWITGRRGDLLEKSASELGVNYKVGDVTKSKDWDELANTVISKSGRIDILVNNAGAAVCRQDIELQSDEIIEYSIALNLISAIYGTKRVLPYMKKQKSGLIINVSSTCCHYSWKGWSVYSAAKGGLFQFSKGVQLEVQDEGVRVTFLAPSWGDTSFIEVGGLQAWDDDVKDKVISPEDFGNVVLDICNLPEHLFYRDITFIPLVQKINPL